MTTMDYAVTLRAMRTLKVQTGSLICLDCPYEDGCSVHGCAILRNAIEHMHDLERALRSSEAARSDLARQLAAARKELAEVKAERDAALRMMWEGVSADDLPELQEESPAGENNAPLDEHVEPEWKRKFMRTFLGGR